MEGIQEFLKRYLNLTPPDGAIRKALTQAIKETVGVTVDPRAIKIVGTVAYVEIDTTTKSVFFIHQHKLIARVEELVGTKGLTGIR